MIRGHYNAIKNFVCSRKVKFYYHLVAFGLTLKQLFYKSTKFVSLYYKLFASKISIFQKYFIEM